ncbi:uncharacterized protein LOC132058610 [Lycium ferocissimum]|uniref:uncharacterized protein LOC132058610 n=1 Tax=Lycium ferocissimum TaxID=112874 RepID=UPI0028168E8F|nr:uncharacterized protein LOC132058610 [Lycium ferocissimum]
MDFIDGLPKSKGKTVIWVVVDRLTKYAHFVGLSHPYSASEIAKLFMENIYKLHGMPEDIVSDRDLVFTSKRIGILTLLLWNGGTTPLSTTQYKTTPYEALYGQPPPMHLPYIAGESGMKEVDRSLLTREFKNQLLQFHLKRAQQRMMDQANKHRSTCDFKRDWVYLKIQPYRRLHYAGRNFNKALPNIMALIKYYKE